jgi:hypothetical protein
VRPSVKGGIGLRSGFGLNGIEAGEIDDDGLGAAANDDPGDGLFGGIQFLMGQSCGNENKVTGTGSFGMFTVTAPADLSTAAEHVNNCFLLAMVVHGTGGMWLGDHNAPANMGRAGKSAIDGG